MQGEDNVDVAVQDARAAQDRFVRMLFFVWIVYSMMWRAPDPALDFEPSSDAAKRNVLQLPIASDGRPQRNMQLFRNVSRVALVDFYVPHGEKERLAASLKLSDAIVHRATPFRPVPGAMEHFYGKSLVAGVSLDRDFGALRKRIAAALRVLSPVNAWAALFKAELGTDVNCVGMCEQGADHRCVGVPDVFAAERCWMPINDECRVGDEYDDDADDNDNCYALFQVFHRPRRDESEAAHAVQNTLASDLRFRWFANRTCAFRVRGCGEPIERLRGDVARAYMYGELAHGASQTGDEWRRSVPRYVFEWAASDAVDDIERRRNEVLYAAQQTRNPFVDFGASDAWWRSRNGSVPE